MQIRPNLICRGGTICERVIRGEFAIDLVHSPADKYT
jgi:hypothetical protein